MMVECTREASLIQNGAMANCTVPLPPLLPAAALLAPPHTCIFPQLVLGVALQPLGMCVISSCSDPTVRRQSYPRVACSEVTALLVESREGKEQFQ